MAVFAYAGWFALGLVLWPVIEYGIHGVLAHRLRSFVSPLHWEHHKHPRRVFTSPLAWVPGAALLFGVFAYLLGAATAGALVAGVLAGFGRYEYLHWRFHFREPRSARERRLRAHHLAHHFRNPKAYHGVTTRLFDRLLGTLPAEHESDYAAVADRPPLTGPSNLGTLLPRRTGS
jgi:sterol desaturase/sphingolipid hydroxylase (fatty acid hydroxylase superfamily)